MLHLTLPNLQSGINPLFAHGHRFHNDRLWDRRWFQRCFRFLMYCSICHGHWLTHPVLHVALVVTSSDETLTASFTSERTLPGVDPPVNGQLTSLGETLVTEITLVLLFTCTRGMEMVTFFLVRKNANMVAYPYE